jgi:glycosidase
MRLVIGAATACTALLPLRPAAGQVPVADTSWVAHSALYEVNIRDFSQTGDLKGVTAGLDRIQASGANVIWLMPVHPVGVLNRKGTLGSPYAARDYEAIDSAFGTEADLKALVRAAHARGLKVILDWVPDHTAWDAVWITRHPEYYARDEKGEITVPRDLQGKLTDWTDVAQLDYTKPGLRQAMIAAMRHWLVDFDLDGFRVDVAGFVPDAFWREAIPTLRAAVPRRILLLAEWGDLNLHRLGFDLTYSWDSYSRLKAVWKGAPADTFVRSEIADLQALPPGGMRLRFTTNHDETAWDNPPVTLFGGSAGARAAFVAAALLPGRPLLYDGQEVESPQKLGLFERDSLVWGQRDTLQTRAFYRRVLELARTSPEFTQGDFAEVRSSVPQDVIGYRRGEAIVLVNTRPQEVRFTVTGRRVSGAVDLLSHAVQQGETITLPAYGAVVLERARTRESQRRSYRRTRSSSRTVRWGNSPARAT